MKAKVKQGDYSFQSQNGKPNRGKPIAGVGFLLLFGVVLVLLQWGDLEARRLKLPTEASVLVGAAALMGFTMLAIGVRQIKAVRAGNIDFVHGSARWATRPEITAASLLPPKGKPGAGVYVGGWVDPKDGRQYYLRHNGKEHLLAFAPTRSGKGVGLVLPTLLSTEFSVVNLDIKGENWQLSSGWRKQQGYKVLRWDPTDATPGRSVTYNPIEEIRFGTPYEVGDIMNVAGILVDPDGRGGEDHWTATARTLLTGVITHVGYRARKEGRTGNLADCLNELAKPGQGYEDTMQEWLSYEHAADENDVFYDSEGNPSESPSHPIVTAAAQMMLNRSEGEASSVLSSAVKYLELYSDPVIARNTARSGFRLTDIMDHETPVTLYLVLNPATIRRIRPLVRLFLTQMIYALLPEMEFIGGEQRPPYKHRLLMLLDEFPSIGKVSIIADSLAYLAGWNIKAYLITQDLAQLWDAYGKEESITSNCHIQIAYSPNKLDTAKYLSDKTGSTTVTIVSESESFNGAGLFAKKSISRQQQQVQRPLLTPDECMRLPGPQKDSELKIKAPGDMLVFSSGYPAIYGRQILYFMDPVFSERAKIEAPECSDVLR